jgi:predicted SPOUT superfamily RNA methylase MTH1
LLGKGAWVNCGIEQEIRVDKAAPPNTRVTVRFDDEQREDGRFWTGKIITPDAVREESGTYWGYKVRLASSLGKVKI